MVALHLLHSDSASQPRHSSLAELLNTRLDLGLVQMKVIDRPDAHDAIAWEASADSIHQCATSRAEEVGHLVASLDRCALGITSQLFLTSNVLEILVVDDEV